MPGFTQFLTGVYLFAGLALFGTFKTPALYSILGIIVFFASLAPDFPEFAIAERIMGFFRLGAGFWLMYLTFAVALNFILGYDLPL
jgi:hypothetical protein